jgi:hypothetical protein
MNSRFHKLRERAIKVGALGNLEDAIHDLLIWPDLKKQILDDFERAIEETERIKKEKESWQAGQQ